MQVGNHDYHVNASIGAYRQTALIQTSKVVVSGSWLEITGGTSGSYLSGGDAVDVSSAAKKLLDRIRELDVFSIIHPDNDARKPTKSLGEVESDFLSDFNDFSGAFGRIASMAGFDVASSITMGLDGVGGITVTGDDSSAVNRVQSVFNGDSTVVARFAVMAARASLADAGYTLDGFGKAYAEDPVAAIKDNIDALKERLLGFRTTGSDGEMRYGFMREFSIEYSSITASCRADAAEVA